MEKSERKKMIEKERPSYRKNGMRVKKNGQIMKNFYVDLPIFYVEKIDELAKKTDKNKNFLVLKALDLLFSSDFR